MWGGKPFTFPKFNKQAIYPMWDYLTIYQVSTVPYNIIFHSNLNPAYKYAKDLADKKL